jgi:putative oxidoreductase
MNFLARLYDGFLGGRAALGLLIFRVVTGLALMIHGWPKIQHATSWMPNDSIPGALQALGAFAEFGGGLMLILGLLTPVAAILVIGMMIGAITLVHGPMGHPWVGQGPSSELAVNYLVAGILLLLTGPGKYSLDAKLFGRRFNRGYADVERKETIGVR